MKIIYLKPSFRLRLKWYDHCDVFEFTSRSVKDGIYTETLPGSIRVFRLRWMPFGLSIRTVERISYSRKTFNPAPCGWFNVDPNDPLYSMPMEQLKELVYKK